MKKTIVSISLFLSLLIAITFFHFNLLKICTTIDDYCTNIEDSLDVNDLDAAYNYSIDLIGYIRDKASSIEVYINHADLNIITNETIRMVQYIHEGSDIGEAYASVHSIRYSTKYMRDLESVSLKNLF